MWFVAKDICDILELEDVSSALRGLDTDEKNDPAKSAESFTTERWSANAEHRERTWPITVEKDGEVWFIAKDVCNVLGIKNPRQAIKALDTDERDDVQILDSIGRTQAANIAGRKKNKLFILSWPIFASPFRQNTGKGDFFIPVKKSFQKVSNDKRI